MNTKNDDGSDLAELMKIYKEQSAFDFKKFPKTSQRKSQFIRHEGGKKQMCELVENYAREVAEEEVKEVQKKAKEEAKEMAQRLFENGVDFDIVYRSIKSFSKEELQAIYEGIKM